MFLENGLSFDSFCGDEVVVQLQGLPTPIAKYSRRSPYIHLDVNICEKHSFQLMVMEHSFPTKVTTSDWIEYEPSPWFNFIDTEVPTYKILWDKGMVSIKWWDLVVNNLDYLQCLTYVDFLSENEVLIDSVLNTNKLVPAQIPLDVCNVEILVVRYTLIGDDGLRARYSKTVKISPNLSLPKQIDHKIENETLVVKADVSLRCYSGDLLLHKNGVILFSEKNRDLEKNFLFLVANFTAEEFCGNLTIDTRLQNKANGSQNIYFTNTLLIKCPIVFRAGLTQNDALNAFGIISGITFFTVVVFTFLIGLKLKQKIKAAFPQ